MSSEQFTRRANAICQRLNVRLAASKDNVRRRSDYARVSPQRAAMISASVAEMRKLLPPPPPAASYWSKVLSDRQALAGYANHVGLAASTNDQAALKADLAASTGVVLDLPSAAAGAGVTECAHVGGPV